LVHLVISDCHVTSGQNLRRFDWLYHLIEDVQPDKVLCIGDFGSFDSLSQHHAKGDATDVSLPQLADELTAIQDAQARMATMLMYPSYMLMGNHEDRWNRFKNMHPKILGESIESIAKYDVYWDYVGQYREWLELDGVSYTHVPHTIMGKPIGGVNATRSVAMQSTTNVVFGHTHTMNCSNVPFIDGNGSRCALSAPAFMEDGNIEAYAKGLPTGWTYGLLLIKPQGPKRPFAYEYISMKDLEDEYSV
jgi:hypothetical protein